MIHKIAIYKQMPIVVQLSRSAFAYPYGQPMPCVSITQGKENMCKKCKEGQDKYNYQNDLIGVLDGINIDIIDRDQIGSILQ